MIVRPFFPKVDRALGLRLSLRLGVGAAVAVVQAGLILSLGLVGEPPQLNDEPAPILVTLTPPPVMLPPPAPAPPALIPGGGAPAAPSRVHLPPRVPDRPPEILAPPTPAPTPPLVVGVAPLSTPAPGPGQGGEGTGAGAGAGDGDGPGAGGTPPLILRGATPAEVLSVVPPEARRARQAGRVSINCAIRLDQRLDDCRVVSETPEGFRFGEAGLRVAAFFRYRPPTSASGRPLEGQRVTISILFGRQ